MEVDELVKSRPLRHLRKELIRAPGTNPSATKCGRGFPPRFSRRSQCCYGEVGSSRLESRSHEKGTSQPWKVQAKSVILILSLLIGLGVESLWAASDKIDWHTYESGMARSRFEKKRVFLYFHAEWCTYCLEMERKTFKDLVVIATLNRNFIPIRVDSDREKTVASLFRVKGLPDSWFLSENGEVIGHRPGFIPSDQMMKILTVIMTGNGGK